VTIINSRDQRCALGSACSAQGGRGRSQLPRSHAKTVDSVLRESLRWQKESFAMRIAAACAFGPVPNYSNRATTPSLNMNCI
jgi:hypothetical protein